jgi:murein DD-endopeptidase MepM/ murein hydrolase activator NlpD
LKRERQTQTYLMRFRLQKSVAAAAFLLVSLAWITWPQPTFAWAVLRKAQAAATTIDSWVYPIAAPQLVRDFWAPSGDYSAGHRGADFAAAEGETVLAVASGIVRFAGQVAGRGVVSITLDDGYVAEVEPVCALVATGERVSAGQQIATACASASVHCPRACLHLSARRFSTDYARGFAYLTPLVFLGAFRQSHLVAISSLG